MVYATYQQYVEEYGGTFIQEEFFEYATKKASRYIDYFTSCKINDENVEEYPELINCACEIAEAVFALAGNNQKQKKSENIDGYSVTYVTEVVDGTTIDAVLRKKAYEIARVYLMHTGLLYCGI